MKQFITPAYTFTPGASGVGTVDLSGISSFDIKRLVSIINQTTGTVIYSTASASLKYTNVSSTTVTLFKDTTGMSSGDVLQVIYDDSGIPLATGASTSALQTSGNASLTSIDGKLPTLLTDVPLQDEAATPVRIVPQTQFRTTFSKAISNNVDTDYFNLLQTGSGMTVNQTGGNLVITSGTTTNSETVIRSVVGFKDALSLRAALTMSQRITNNNVFIEMCDVVGDGLAFTINSATSVTVTIPGTTWTSANVGQSVVIQQISGAAGIPGRYAIASVSGTSVTFTVAAWPASGSGTLSLTGWNYMRVLFSGTNQSSATVDTQRKGYNTGSSSTIGSAASSSGMLIEMVREDGTFAYADAGSSAATSPTFTQRMESVQSIPDPDVVMYMQIRVVNGSSAPASTTTSTIGVAQILNWASQRVVLSGIAGMSKASAIPVTFPTGVTLPTVTTVSSVTSSSAGIPLTASDVASGAITSTTTTADRIPTNGISYTSIIVVTAASGTNPTLDVAIEESDDSGVNYFRVYEFPRITGAGVYRSPLLPLTTGRIRYVQTVGGTTPSFTRAINRFQSNHPANPFRQIVDRTVTLTTLNSTTPSLTSVFGATNAQLIINVGAITTTAPQLQLEGSDDAGVSWYAIGSPVTAVASSTVTGSLNVASSGLVRARVSTAGVGVTAGYVIVRISGKA